MIVKSPYLAQLETAKLYRDRAEECWTIGEAMHDPRAKNTMLQCAEWYMGKADALAAKLKQEGR
jgi:hypothetical protein